MRKTMVGRSIGVSKNIPLIAFAALAHLSLFAAGGSAEGKPGPAAEASLETELVVGGRAIGASGVRQDDFIRNGSKLRLVIQARKSVRVTVRHRAPGGAVSVLATKHRVGRGKLLVLPGSGAFFRVDGRAGRGVFEVSITRNGQSRLIRLRYQLLGANEARAPVLPVLNKLAGKTKTAENAASPFAELLFFEAGKRIGGLRRLGTLRGEGAALRSRGPSDVRLFRVASKAVVLVFAKKSMGSGSVITASGYVLTNWHVIVGHKKVGVIFKPRRPRRLRASDAYVARVVYADKKSDLALLKIVRPPRDLRWIRLASIKEAEVGTDVHAIGHPQGQVWSYTKGIISAIRPGYQWKTKTSSYTHSATVIQTQTPISPGSSGGPLLLSSGRLIGVNSFGSTTGQALNYAVSSVSVRIFLRKAMSRAGGAAAARSGRLPAHPVWSASASGIKSRRKPKILRYDLNKNGRIDAWGYDFNHNGAPELYAIDRNEDGKVDYWLLDKNENRKFEAKIVPKRWRGRIVHLWLIDRDEDGKYEIAGIDYDRDGKIDRYKRLS